MTAMWLASRGMGRSSVTNCPGSYHARNIKAAGEDGARERLCASYLLSYSYYVHISNSNQSISHCFQETRMAQFQKIEALVESLLWNSRRAMFLAVIAC